MKLFPILFVAFLLFTPKAKADATLREIKGSNTQMRYLEYFIPQSESSGTYKIWNLTQNKQVGADIKKSSAEVSDIISFEGNPGDKYTIIDSNGDVLAAFSDGARATKTSEISGNPSGKTATTTPVVKNKIVKMSDLYKNSNGANPSKNAVGEDQITYIKAQKKSYEDINKSLRARLAERRGQLKILLKKNSDQEIDKLCGGKVTTSQGKTLSVITRCEDLQTLEEGVKVSESNLSKITKYEEEATKSLGTSSPVATTPSSSNQPTQLETATNTKKTCSPIRGDTYIEHKLRSSALLFSEVIIPGSLENSSLVSTPWVDGNLRGEAGRINMKEAAEQEKRDVFLDGCYLFDFNSKDHARDSSLQYKYTKIKGVRRLNVSCENGAAFPTDTSPIKDFRYDSSFERVVRCPVERHEASNTDFKYTCGVRNEYDDHDSKYMFGDRFEAFPETFFTIWDYNDPERLKAKLKIFQGLNLNAKSPEELIPENDNLASKTCAIDGRIYNVGSKYIFECTSNETAPFKFIGPGRLTYSDVTEDYKRSYGSPFSKLVGYTGTWEEVLAKYPKCADYKINLADAFNYDKDKKLDGIYISTTSNEEFKIEEKIAISRIIIRGLSGYAEYKAMADKKNGEKTYIGQGVDYPGTCKEIAPFTISIDRVSDDELKVTQTMLEDSCGVKKDSQTSFTLKRK